MGINHRHLAYPPGGILIWIIIYLELVTFGLAILGLVYYGFQEQEAYRQSSLMLNKPIATLNTVLLLTGGWLAAQGVYSFRKNLYEQTVRLFMWAIGSGIGFLILKGFEYYQKIKAGLDMNYDTFYMFYWFLTGFHWIHVLVGVVILSFIRQAIIRKKRQASLEDIEAGVAFWHMCDLIWLLLFPLLYLLF